MAQSTRSKWALAGGLVVSLALGACGGPEGHADGGDAGGDARPVTPLPTLEGIVALEDRNPDPRVVEVDLTASETEVEFVAGRRTRALAYNGSVPGPLLHARVGDRVIVHFTNALTQPTTVHWHGLRIADTMDGSPRVQTPVPAGGTFTYDFVVPDAGTFWYHAHVNEIEQLEKGLYGALVVHDVDPPRFRAERVLMLDDVRIDTNGQVSRFLTSGPDIGRGRVGNRLLANGRSEPETVRVARGAVERWRIVNSGGALTHYLSMQGAYFRVIATDGGYLPTPSDPGEIELAAGQRVDLEVRHTMAGSTGARLISSLQVQRADGTVGTQEFSMMNVEYTSETVADEPPAYPAVTLPPIEGVEARAIDLMLSGMATDTGVAFTVNGQSGHQHRTPPIQVMRGQPVRITIRADVSPEHPFHLHGQFFQVVARGGSLVSEPGLYDVALVRGRESLTILTYFENPGMWMFHCHIPEHSQNGMMGEFEVLDR